MGDILYKEECYRIQGAIFEVYREMGCGFLEKAVKKLLSDHRAQLHNYLKTSKSRLGLLVNFGHYPKAEIERIIL